MRRGVGMIIGLLALCTWALAQPAPDTVLPQRAADFWRLVAEAPTVQDSQLEALFSAGSIERIGRDGLRDLLGQLHEDLGDTVVKLTPTLVQDQGAPPVTNNDFIPTEQNLSDCIGAVEKPNCGSESKGGWRMYLVFAALVLGMGVVGWRIAVGVRARDAVVNSLPEDTPPTAPAG